MPDDWKKKPATLGILVVLFVMAINTAGSAIVAITFADSRYVPRETYQQEIASLRREIKAGTDLTLAKLETIRKEISIRHERDGAG